MARTNVCSFIGCIYLAMGVINPPSLIGLGVVRRDKGWTWRRMWGPGACPRPVGDADPHQDRHKAQYISLKPHTPPPQGTRKGYPYHGPTCLRSRLIVHGRGIPCGYPGGRGREFCPYVRCIGHQAPAATTPRPPVPTHEREACASLQ